VHPWSHRRPRPGSSLRRRSRRRTRRSPPSCSSGSKIATRYSWSNWSCACSPLWATAGEPARLNISAAAGTRASMGSSGKMCLALIGSTFRPSDTRQTTRLAGRRSKPSSVPFTAQADRGVFIATSRFTTEARDYAERVPARLVLIDGVRLAQLMLLHNVGVQEEETFILKRVDEDFFESF